MKTDAAGRMRQTGIWPFVAHGVAILVVLPLAWTIFSAFKPGDELFQSGLPSVLTLENFRYALTELELPRYLWNSAVVAVVTTVVALWLHTMAAYALARLKFPFRGAIFTLIISTLLVSLPVILVPLFLVVKQLGMLDSYAGLIVPMIFNAFGIFLLRQYYLNIPRELEEAAELDGCGYWRRYWNLVLPLSRPIMAALAVLFFLANWNAFLWPLTVTESADLKVVQVGIAGLQGQYAAAWETMLAASVLAAVPTVIVFLLGQKWLVDAMKTSGIK